MVIPPGCGLGEEGSIPSVSTTISFDYEWVFDYDSWGIEFEDCLLDCCYDFHLYGLGDE